MLKSLEIKKKIEQKKKEELKNILNKRTKSLNKDYDKISNEINNWKNYFRESFNNIEFKSIYNEMKINHFKTFDDIKLYIKEIYKDLLNYKKNKIVKISNNELYKILLNINDIIKFKFIENILKMLFIYTYTILVNNTISINKKENDLFYNNLRKLKFEVLKYDIKNLFNLWLFLFGNTIYYFYDKNFSTDIILLDERFYINIFHIIFIKVYDIYITDQLIKYYNKNYFLKSNIDESKIKKKNIKKNNFKNKEFVLNQFKKGILNKNLFKKDKNDLVRNYYVGYFNNSFNTYLSNKNNKKINQTKLNYNNFINNNNFKHLKDKKQKIKLIKEINNKDDLAKVLHQKLKINEFKIFYKKLDKMKLNNDINIWNNQKKKKILKNKKTKFFKDVFIKVKPKYFEKEFTYNINKTSPIIKKYYFKKDQRKKFIGNNFNYKKILEIKNNSKYKLNKSNDEIETDINKNNTKNNNLLNKSTGNEILFLDKINNYKKRIEKLKKQYNNYKKAPIQFY